MLVARARLRQVRAHVATLARMGRDRARARLHARPARLGARGPRREGRDLAMLRARTVVARLRLSRVRASRAAETRLRQHAGARLHASAARLGAGAPRAKLANHAVQWATVCVALARLRTVRASLAADHGLRQRATATLRPSAARRGARAPAAPRTDNTVHCAKMLVARACFGTMRTGSTTEARAHICTSALLRSTTARLGARRPLRPCGHATVGRARVCVARARFRRVRARRATKLRRSAPARALLHATAARLGACCPNRPLRDAAVLGARLLVAIACFCKVWAQVATVSRMRQHGTCTVLRPEATSCGTRAPSAEFRHLAVHGTRAVIAGLALGRRRTRKTPVLWLLERARAALAPLCARLAASAPRAPRARCTVNRAQVRVT